MEGITDAGWTPNERSGKTDSSPSFSQEGPRKTRGFRSNSRAEIAWQPGAKRVCWRHMGHCKGKDNVKKHAKRHKKAERLKLAKLNAAPVAK